MTLPFIAFVTLCLVARHSHAGSIQAGAASGTYYGKVVSTQQWPNGGFTATVQLCQQTCRTAGNFCAAYTYMPAANGATWGPGACWLYGPGAVLETSDSTSGYQSGFIDATVERPQLNAPGAANSAAAAGSARGRSAKDGGMAHATLWMLAILGVAALVTMAYFLYCHSSSTDGQGAKRKKKKRTASMRAVAVASADAEHGSAANTEAEVRPLVASVAPAFVPQYTLAVNGVPQYTTASVVQLGATGGSNQLTRQFAQIYDTASGVQTQPQGGSTQLTRQVAKIYSSSPSALVQGSDGSMQLTRQAAKIYSTSSSALVQGDDESTQLTRQVAQVYD